MAWRTSVDREHMAGKLRWHVLRARNRHVQPDATTQATSNNALVLCCHGSSEARRRRVHMWYDEQNESRTFAGPATCRFPEAEVICSRTGLVAQASRNVGLTTNARTQQAASLWSEVNHSQRRTRRRYRNGPIAVPRDAVAAVRHHSVPLAPAPLTVTIERVI